MGVQTLKHGVFLAAGLVGAVLLIQGTGTVLGVPGSSVVSGIAIAASNRTDASQKEASLPLALSDTTSATSTTTASGPASLSSVAKAGAPAGTKTAKSAVKTGASGGSHSQSSSGSSSAGSSSSTAPTSGPTSAPASPPPPPPPATPTCPAAIGGGTAGAPGAVSVNGIPGTSTADLNSFAAEYNAIRVANCLAPVPPSHIRYSSCLEQRLFWMADDPSSNPYSAWGHTGVAVRSDGLPIVGCDGDLAGGSGYTGASVAQAWWASPDHRASLFQPGYTGSTAGVCIYFAMTHGGYNNPGPNEPYSFTRAAAYWAGC
jgi:hypothetical protein